MTTLRERNRQRTRDDIAEAALSLFERRGYEKTTIEQIAVAAGVSSATFFRYFPAKEDVLFNGEDEAAAALVEHVAHRTDRARTIAALSAPVAAYAQSLTDGSVPRLTRLVMTTRTLEERSLRMRLLWEHQVAEALAKEKGEGRPGLAETATAAIAVSCLTSGLRHWDYQSPTLAGLVLEAFQLCADPEG